MLNRRPQRTFVEPCLREREIVVVDQQEVGLRDSGEFSHLGAGADDVNFCSTGSNQTFVGECVATDRHAV